MQRNMPARAAPDAAPARPAQATPNTPPTAGAAPAAPRRSWMGPLAGLAAGLGIAALMSHLGMGEEFGNIIMMVLLAGLAFVAIRFVMSRMRGAQARPAMAGSNGLQFAGAPAGANAPWSAGSSSSGSAPEPAPLAPAAPVAPAAFAASPLVPVGFDQEGFERIAKMIFIRLQAANDSADLNDLRQFTTPEMFAARYANVFDGDERWQAIKVEGGATYRWNTSSTYVQNPPYFDGMTMTPDPIKEIENARILALFGDKITTDHLSPAGSIKVASPAGKWLSERQVRVEDFNQYGTRRGNHEVMMRGTFANIRIKNFMLRDAQNNVPEGGNTVHYPSGEKMSIYDAAMKYQAEETPLVIFAGEEYGNGSSRDWAAKGTALLGIKAVIARSFERIHRSNLVGMGVLPLVYSAGATAESLGLTGHEEFDVLGIAGAVQPRQDLQVVARHADGRRTEFTVRARIDTPVEAEYYRNGGILQTVLRNLART
jgi:aconitase A